MSNKNGNAGRGSGNGVNDATAMSAVSGVVHETTPNSGGQAENSVNAPIAGILNSNALENGQQNSGNSAAQNGPGSVILPDSVSLQSPSPVIANDDGAAILTAPRDNGVDPPIIVGGSGDDVDPPIIVPGPTPPSLNEILGNDGADVLVGTSDADLIDGGGGADLIISNGGGDHLLGGEGDDIIVISGSDFGKIDGGLGTDTLFLANGLDLDLGAVSDKVESIERLDLTAHGANDVSLHISDLLDVTDDGQLTVLGKPQDSVTADFTGHAVAHQLQGGFDIYTIDNGVAQLIVEHQVDQNIII
jgi:Ca2+-binding RTX toxin-like protein